MRVKIAVKVFNSLNYSGICQLGKNYVEPIIFRLFQLTINQLGLMSLFTFFEACDFSFQLSNGTILL